MMEKIELTNKEQRAYDQFVDDIRYECQGDEKHEIKWAKSFNKAFMEDVKRNRKLQSTVNGWIEEMRDVMPVSEDEANKIRVKLYKQARNEDSFKVLINGQIRQFVGYGE